MVKARTGPSSAAAAVAVCLVLLAGWFALWPVQLGGASTYVTTRGNSMEPRFDTGDLAVLRQPAAYRVGDVAAYHSRVLKQVVMHRIVAVQDDRYTFKGDNNSWLDPEQPAPSQLIGTLAVRVPNGGLWLDRATSPPALGIIAFLMVAAGGATVQTRRRRRRPTMSRHITGSTDRSGPLRALSPQLRTAAAAVAATAILGLTIGALAWAGPLDTPGTGQQQAGQSMTFSYTAAVPKTPAYDGTRVTSPDPVFRKLANTVAVQYTYRGDPGTVAVDATLSTASGWHSTIPLVAARTFNTDGYEGTVRLDLKAFDARAQAAAAATGIPTDQVSIAVVPKITTTDGANFAPALQLALSPLQLTLVGDTKAMTVKDPAAAQQSTGEQSTGAARTMGLLGHHLTMSTARVLAAVLLLAALLAAVVLAVLARRSRTTGEAATIHRRYAPLLVAIHPMPTPPGHPVLDVPEFTTLVKLAERYGLLILHWSRSDVETFIVQDDATTYRYRTGAALNPIAADADATVL